MRILIFTWKDRKHPFAGGAEVVNEELVRRLITDGHEVTMLVGGFPGCNPEEQVDGYRVIRVGSWYTVYWHAYKYYREHLQGWADVVIEEVNTIPFFTKFYVKEPSVLFFHQLCRRIWFYQMHPPLSLMGYLSEPLYLRLLATAGKKVITVSESTKQDLLRHGFSKSEIALISEGVEIEPIADPSLVQKYEHLTLLSLGNIRPMKRTLHQVKAFEMVKRHIPHLRLKIAGKMAGRYGQKVWRHITNSPYRNDIEYLGEVTHEQKQTLMQKCHLIMVTSVKEGWGLIVTEAASQGTPAVVYNVDGLRDSVQHGKTGMVTAPNPYSLAEGVQEALDDQKAYATMRKAAWLWSQDITFDQSYRDFKQAMELA